MIKHMVLFRFRPDVDDALRDEIVRDLRALPSRFPAMKRFSLGENISRRDQTLSHAMTIEFDTAAELEAYLDSPEHEAFVATKFKPCVEQRFIVSMQA